MLILGEIAAFMTNRGDKDVYLKPGFRICQIVLEKYEADFDPVELCRGDRRNVTTERSLAGFGSTGYLSTSHKSDFDQIKS